MHGLEHELGYKDSRFAYSVIHIRINRSIVCVNLHDASIHTTIRLTMVESHNLHCHPLYPTFELTILFASVGMVIVYCVRNGLALGRVPRIL